ncbi:MAG: twin-arginine translocation signal domain-containing protein, partial [Coriobacteriales bacterium]|nr:twin-arginine translocation signal domain-containing protein [Coriobacteriales bacterium]
MSEGRVPSELTRRSFLKTTAVVAGTAALAGGYGC